MRRTEAFLLLVFFLVTLPAMAQTTSRPTDAPAITADSAPWYVAREPVQVGADLYYPAGASVFFDGNTMVQTGTYNGVPLYSDKTLEPHSVVYVPISRGMMQPYERPRSGDLAGTTASRTPSFPVAVSGTSDLVGPTDVVPAPTDAVPAATTGARTPIAVSTSGTVTPVRPVQKKAAIRIGERPASDDGVWIQYRGEKWISAGAAIPLTHGGFRQVGSYSGFPVFARQGVSDQVIYVQTRDGFVAPYKLKP